MENIWRRFKIIGSSENEKKLNQLVEDKKLTREKGKYKLTKMK